MILGYKANGKIKILPSLQEFKSFRAYHYREGLPWLFFSFWGIHILFDTANIVQSQMQACKLDEEFSPPSNLHWTEKENLESIHDAWVEEEQTLASPPYYEFPFCPVVCDFETDVILSCLSVWPPHSCRRRFQDEVRT